MYEWIHNEPEAAEGSCKEITTVINSISEHDKRPEECQHCGYTGDRGWRKVLSGGKFILQGYGWARDGYS